jgi:hypothetical protein
MTDMAVGMRTSHRSLTNELWALPRHRRARVRGIVVPATRSPRHLKFAISLADACSAVLVVLCSRGAFVEAVQEELARCPGTRAILVQVPEDEYQIPGFRPWTAREPDLLEANAYRSSDLSLKRNIGLLLARYLGWENVVFIDDDIHQVTAADLGRLVGRLDARHPVAAMACPEFPDNSVVCHANRSSGNHQDVFVSGSVLAVDCTTPVAPFFPDIYNEDWFFFHEFAARRRLVHSGFSQQLPFDPFEDPGRAEREEFGDLLAEGLFAYLQGSPPYAADEPIRMPAVSYWEDFIPERQAFIDRALTAFENSATFDPRAVDSLRLARKKLSAITAAQCALFLKVLGDDQESWRCVLSKAAERRTPAAALGSLDLTAIDATGARIA